jgi:hypothetical protein
VSRLVKTLATIRIAFQTPLKSITQSKATFAFSRQRGERRPWPAKRSIEKEHHVLEAEPGRYRVTAGTASQRILWLILRELQTASGNGTVRTADKGKDDRCRSALQEEGRSLHTGKAGCELLKLAANEVPQCRLQRFALPLLRGNGRMLSVAMVPPLN